MYKRRKKESLINKRFIARILLFVSIWTLFVLYPNPYQLGVTLYRIYKPAVDSKAILHMLDQLPNDPQAIENYVLEKLPYQYDWQTYGVPFYFPTAKEAVLKGTGDCKTRFIVIASIFEAMEIPYNQSFSLSHFWIDYEGKTENNIEQSDYALILRDESGTRLQLPKEDLVEIFDVLKEGFWDYMPLPRKILLTLGLPLSILLSYLVTIKQNRKQNSTKVLMNYYS